MCTTINMLKRQKKAVRKVQSIPLQTRCGEFAISSYRHFLPSVTVRVGWRSEVYICSAGSAAAL